MIDDTELLARYAAEVSEDAFAELTRRHTALVYSAALRQVRNEQLAQDVTQVVFANLARKARSIPRGTVLAGWLHRDTRYTALDFLRAEARRLRREQQSVEMNATNPCPLPGWEEIRPLLDEALTKLAPADRDALLLRYFEQQEFAEVGAALGASGEAARKRVDRALEKLREHLVKCGITTTAAALGGALTAHAVEAVPAGLVVSLAGCSTAAAASGSASWFSNLMIMSKTKIAIGMALVAGILAAPLIIQQQALAAARAEQSELQARLSVSVPTDQVAVQASDGSDRAARDRADLEKLRRESAGLRTKIAELSTQAQKLLAASPMHKPGGIPLDVVLRYRDVRDSGQASPATALETFMWAMAHGDTNRISQTVVIERGPNGRHVQEILDDLNKESANVRRRLDKVGYPLFDLHLMEEHPGDNNDRWVVYAAMETNGAVRNGRILFRPTDMGWRSVIGTNGNPVEEVITEQP